MSLDSWVICLEEVLPEFGVSLSNENILKLAEAMKDNASGISDMEFDMLGGRSAPEVDYKSLYLKAKEELELCQHEHSVFRRNVAYRHKVDTSSVVIENNTVMVYP